MLHAADEAAQGSAYRAGALCPAEAAQQLQEICSPRSRKWLHFPDPAGRTVLQGRAARAEEILRACQDVMRGCQQSSAWSRTLLRHCRSQLEEQQKITAGVRELLGGNCWSWLWTEGGQRAFSGPIAAKNRCVGKARCYFCRERQGLIAVPKDSGLDKDAEVFADVSSCCYDTPWEVEVPCVALPAPGSESAGVSLPDRGQANARRRSYRERGRPVYKPRSRSRALPGPQAQQTWYARHTEEPQAQGARQGDLHGHGQGASTPGSGCRAPASRSARAGRQLPQRASSKAGTLERPDGRNDPPSVLSPYLEAARRLRADFQDTAAEGAITEASASTGGFWGRSAASGTWSHERPEPTEMLRRHESRRLHMRWSRLLQKSQRRKLQKLALLLSVWRAWEAALIQKKRKRATGVHQPVLPKPQSRPSSASTSRTVSLAQSPAGHGLGKGFHTSTAVSAKSAAVKHHFAGHA